MRGDRKKQEEREKGRRESGSETAEDVQIIDVGNYKQKRIPQLMWRECIKKVWEVDPLSCPKCTGEMRIISFIYKKKVIKKILIHLGVNQEKHNQRAPPITEPEYTEPETVTFDDGWQEYEEAVIES